MVEEDEIQVGKGLGDELVVHPAPHHRRDPLVERRGERNLSQRHLGSDRIWTEHEDHRISTADQGFYARPQRLKVQDVCPTDEGLEAARLERRIKMVGEGDVPAATGDEDLDVGLAGLRGTVFTHGYVP